jgi:RND family efflux transporter MFP subunit
MKSKWVQLGLTTVVVLAGIGAAALMVLLGQTAEKNPTDEISTPVTTLNVERGVQPITVEATGIVQPAQSVRIIPEVAGRITKVAKEFVPGGRFEAGDIMVTIDSRDYAAGVQEAEARVQQAALELQIEQGRGAVAEREWKLLSSADQSEAEAALALRKPHLLTAQRTLNAAEAGLERANLRLSRTRIRAPFNAVVVNENVAVGQVVGSTGPIGTVVGTDTLWVTVSLSVSDVRTLDIPGVNNDVGSRALVSQRLSNGASIRRAGQVLHLIGQLDPQTRNAQLLVGIDGAMEADETGSILLPGAYVSVTLFGRDISDGFTLPRTALRENSRIWAVEDGRLALKSVQVQGGDQDSVVCTSDITNGTPVITSSIALPVEGMLVSSQE